MSQGRTAASCNDAFAVPRLNGGLNYERHQKIVSHIFPNHAYTKLVDGEWRNFRFIEADRIP